MHILHDAAALTLLALCALGLLRFPSESAAAAQEGIELCLETVLPALFPFFVLSSLMVQSSAPQVLSRAFARFMRPLFGVGGAGASALLLGLLGGYPVGARTVAELYACGAVEREEAEQLLAFCNNSGPGFFLGVCGASVFSSTRAGVYLYLIHVLSAFFTGMLLRRRLPPRPRARQRGVRGAPQFDLAAAFPAAVQSSFAAAWNVCGFVVLFLVLLRLLSHLPFLRALPPLWRALVYGFAEMTNGVLLLPPTREGFVLCAVILNWGGLSVQAQTRAVLSGSGLTARLCMRGKAVQAAVGLPLALLLAPRLF